MFGFARAIVRNKFIFIGLIAVVGFLFFGQKQDDDASKPHNPWSNVPAQTAQVSTSTPDKNSLTAKALNIADRAAKAAGAEDFAPSALREKSVGNLEKASSAVNNAGGN